MSQEKLPMNKTKEIFRLHFESKLSNRQIARCHKISRGTVQNYLFRFALIGLAWPLPTEIDDVALNRLLFPPKPPGPQTQEFFIPDWVEVHRELKRKGVTRYLLWEEYRQSLNPEQVGYSYNRFCGLYKEWEKKLGLSMRQTHVAGDKLFVDYSGKTIPVLINLKTGEIREAQVFVAVLGASNYTYAEATWTQASSDWIASHTRAFEFFGGVTKLLIPDNLKSGVKKPDLYESVINRSYEDMATHYGTAVMPARVRRPKDKAKAEIGVCVVLRWILAKLRNRTFTSLAEANIAIADLLPGLNNKHMQKIKRSRRELFEECDKPALSPLPQQRYVYLEFKKCRPGPGYHVTVEDHDYSVHHSLYGQKLEARYSDKIVEIYHKGRRVASHVRLYGKQRNSTLPEHMPSTHRFRAEWTPERFIKWARNIGEEPAIVCKKIMEKYKHPELGFKSCLGIISLEKKYGKDRLIAACKKAVVLKAFTYSMIKNQLKTGMDKMPLQQTELPLVTSQTWSCHDNIRGGSYYNGKDETNDNRRNNRETGQDEDGHDGQIDSRKTQQTRPSGPESSGNDRVDHRRRISGEGEPQNEQAPQKCEVQNNSNDGGHRLSDQAGAYQKQDVGTRQSQMDHSEAEHHHYGTDRSGQEFCGAGFGSPRLSTGVHGTLLPSHKTPQ